MHLLIIPCGSVRQVSGCKSLYRINRTLVHKLTVCATKEQPAEVLFLMRVAGHIHSLSTSEFLPRRAIYQSHRLGLALQSQHRVLGESDADRQGVPRI